MTAPTRRFDAGLALVRLAAGLLIARHGLAVFDADGMRGMGEWLSTDLHLPAGLLMAYLAKGTEFGGGLLVAVGLLTRPAAGALVVTMAVALFGAHADELLAAGENALLYGLLFLVFACVGAGRWSVDQWLGTRRGLVP